MQSIGPGRLRRKCRLASDSIAEGYSVHSMHAIDSDKVLGKQRYPAQSIPHSERTCMAIRPEPRTPKASQHAKGDLKWSSFWSPSPWSSRLPRPPWRRRSRIPMPARSVT